MSAHPKLHQDFITITPASEGGWLVITPRGHGWLHGDRRSAHADARWLSKNLGLGVFETTTTTDWRK